MNGGRNGFKMFTPPDLFTVTGVKCFRKSKILLFYYIPCCCWSSAEIKESCSGVKAEVGLIRIYYNNRKSEKNMMLLNHNNKDWQLHVKCVKEHGAKQEYNNLTWKGAGGERKSGASRGAGTRTRGRFCCWGRGPADWGAWEHPAETLSAVAWPEPLPPAARRTPP